MLKILKILNWKEWLLVLVCIGLIFTQVWLDLKLPDYMSAITTEIQSSGDINKIWQNGGWMLLCALASGLLAVAVTFISAMIGANLSKRLRLEIYKKVSTFSPTEMHKFHISSLITRSTNDITQIAMTISMGLQIIIKAPIMAVWAIIKIVSKNWQWSLATAIAVLVLITAIIIIICLTYPKFKIVQKQTDDLNRATSENLSGIRVIRAFNAENFQEQKFEKTNSALTKTNLFTSYAMSFFNPVMHIVMNGISIAIYIIGAYLIDAVASPVEKLALFSDMVVFFSYAMRVISAFLMLVIIFMILPRTIVSANRVVEVLQTEPKIKDGAGVIATEQGTIKFENVTFAYADAKEPVIKNISFEIKKGEMVAIIGATGSGKSTIIKLIPRLYDATSGNVLVDGQNVKDYKLSDLYDKLGYISQKAVLFSGTVESNVSMGQKHNKKPTNEQIVDAIKNSQSETFVQNMNGTYKAQIYQGGTNVSGGQKQRLNIARALAREPEILIFDDSFSALDYKTDRDLRNTLQTTLSGTTCIIVAQRIGTIKNCDKIIVVESGQIVGIGTHKELMKNCEVYEQIALSQLSKEELADGTK